MSHQLKAQFFTDSIYIGAKNIRTNLLFSCFKYGSILIKCEKILYR